MNDAQLTQMARERLKEAVAVAVIELVQSLARERGSSPLSPSIAGPDAAAAFRALAEQLELCAQELRVLAELSAPGWEVALTAEELRRSAAACVADAIHRVSSPRADGSAKAG